MANKIQGKEYSFIFRILLPFIIGFPFLYYYFTGKLEHSSPEYKYKILSVITSAYLWVYAFNWFKSWYFRCSKCKCWGAGVSLQEDFNDSNDVPKKYSINSGNKNKIRKDSSSTKIDRKQCQFCKHEWY